MDLKTRIQNWENKLVELKTPAKGKRAQIRPKSAQKPVMSTPQVKSGKEYTKDARKSHSAKKNRQKDVL